VPPAPHRGRRGQAIEPIRRDFDRAHGVEGLCARLGQDRPGREIADHALALLRLAAPIDGEERGADAAEGKDRDHVLRRLLEADPDRVAGRNPGSPEKARRGADRLVELPVGETAPVTDQGRQLRPAFGILSDRLGQVHGSSGARESDTSRIGPALFSANSLS
jgi:hypothetical protein